MGLDIRDQKGLVDVQRREANKQTNKKVINFSLEQYTYTLFYIHHTLKKSI